MTEPLVDVVRELEQLRLIRDVARQLVTAESEFEREACLSLLRQLVDPVLAAATALSREMVRGYGEKS
jgi:hypothetical protein